MATAFRENGVEFDRVNYFIDQLTETKLRSLLKKAEIGPSEILRKREKMYKELDLASETDNDKLIKMIVKHPQLLERPIVEIGDKAVVARPIDKAIALIKEAEEK
ncbi:MAG: ArsC/Spx/MgsR family protein [Pyrinomonadaceae bacterium]